jgi:3-hydroxyisobutyrate dehydrogenase-like beta-hydroxyacid dehydrogenase
MAELRTVGLLSPGEMGAAIGGVLVQGGLNVITCLDGRGALTRLRASEAGIDDVADYDLLVERADLVLSVLVPSEARALAERVAGSMTRTSARPPYVDCNAISPQTVRELGATIQSAGADFIDAGIIGGPPRRPAEGRTRFYCSGPATAVFESLREYGLDVRGVGPEIGRASSLKMVYAASTKGTTALWTELLIAARRLGVEALLLDEFGDSAGPARQLQGIPSMPRRARRWIGEMEEIAATFAGAGLTPLMLEGAAEVYRLVGASPLADQTERDPDPSLESVLDVLAGESS